MSDSLEFNAANNGTIRNNSDGIKHDDNETIEQENVKSVPDKTEIGRNRGGGNGGSGSGSDDGHRNNDGKSSQFLPFAHIGTNWSNDGGAKTHIGTDDDRKFDSNYTTNQFRELDTTNQTNNFDVHTNQSSLITKQTSETEFQMLPGTSLPTHKIIVTERGRRKKK